MIGWTLELPNWLLLATLGIKCTASVIKIRTGIKITVSRRIQVRLPTPPQCTDVRGELLQHGHGGGVDGEVAGGQVGHQGVHDVAYAGHQGSGHERHHAAERLQGVEVDLAVAVGQTQAEGIKHLKRER